MKKTILTSALITLGMTVLSQAAVYTLDNTDAGYSESGTWGGWSGDGEEGTDYRYTDEANATATWSFTGLASGKYIASASHTLGGTRSTDATYNLSDGIGSLGPVNQQLGGIYSEGSRISSTVFTVNDGTLTSTVSASSGVLVADSFRLESVRADVMAIYVIDNENPSTNNGTFTQTVGTWSTWDGEQHYNNYAYGTSADAAAQYAFTGLADGTYRVSANWAGGGNRPNDALYSVVGGPSITVDQVAGSNEDTFEGVAWNDLFTVDVTGGALTVNLENVAGGNGQIALIADGMRLEQISAVPEPSSAALLGLGGLALILRRRK